MAGPLPPAQGQGPEASSPPSSGTALALPECVALGIRGGNLREKRRKRDGRKEKKEKKNAPSEIIVESNVCSVLAPKSGSSLSGSRRWGGENLGQHGV